jgi:hypothetical protein
VDKTPPLPILAQPQRDRAGLGDPTTAASLAFVLKPLAVQRAGQTPFSPVTLPDPFEHRRTVEVREPPAENPQPLSVTFPRLPGVK